MTCKHLKFRKLKRSVLLGHTVYLAGWRDADNLLRFFHYIFVENFNVPRQVDATTEKGIYAEGWNDRLEQETKS